MGIWLNGHRTCIHFKKICNFLSNETGKLRCCSCPHLYGGFVITNAAFNNPNVTGLVYIAALAPDEGETGHDFFESLPEEFSKMFFESIVSDSAGYLYFDPDKFRESFAQDVDPTEANIWATVQKPTNQSLTAEKIWSSSMEAIINMVSGLCERPPYPS